MERWESDLFQSIILQRAQGVKKSAQIRKRILFRLNLWNYWGFDKLVKDTYKSAMGYLRKARENQTMEERQWTFSNLVLNGKLRKSVQFFREREKGGVLQPDKLAADRTVKIKKTVTSVLEGEYLIKKIPSCATLETYEDTPILIRVDIT